VLWWVCQESALATIARPGIGCRKLVWLILARVCCGMFVLNQSECDPITQCVSSVSCTRSGGSLCSECAPGTYLDNTTDVNSNRCKRTFSTFYYKGLHVPVCTQMPGCTGTVTCTNSADSACSSRCTEGYYLDSSGVCRGMEFNLYCMIYLRLQKNRRVLDYDLLQYRQQLC
jgi:hypothetical protein